MRAIDTNVLVRLLTGDDRRQTALAEAYVEKGVWVSHLVLVETVWVLATVFDQTAARIVSALEMLLAHKSMTIQDSETVRAALEHYRKRPALDFADCLILEVARKAGHVPVGTFDRDLAKLAGAEQL